MVLRAAASGSRRRGSSPGRKSAVREISIWTNSQMETVLRWCLACWLRTGDSPVSQATTVIALRLLGATGLGRDSMGHFGKPKWFEEVRFLQAVSRM